MLNYSTSPSSDDLFRTIIIFFQKVFDYLEVITSNNEDDEEKKDFIKDLNKDWDYRDTEIDYNIHEKKQSLEEKDCKNSNEDIDKNDYELGNIILFKSIVQEFRIENQNNEYSLEFNSQGVYLKKDNSLFEKIKISDETYQMGKVIEIENEKDKNKLLAITIKNKDTKSKIFLCVLDLINNTKNYLIIESEYPPIKDYSFFILDKNELKQLILLLCCEFKIHLIKFDFYKSNNKEYILKLSNTTTKEVYPFKKFNPNSICVLRIFKKGYEILEKYRVFSEYFLVSSQTNLKLFKYNEKGDLKSLCDVEFEKKENQAQILKEKNYINRIEQSDEGIISIHLNKKKINCYLFLNE